MAEAEDVEGDERVLVEIEEAQSWSAGEIELRELVAGENGFFEMGERVEDELADLAVGGGQGLELRAAAQVEAGE